MSRTTCLPWFALLAGCAAGCSSGPPEGSGVGHRLPELDLVDLAGEQVVVQVAPERALAVGFVSTWSGASRQLAFSMAGDDSVERVLVACGEPPATVARWAAHLPGGTRVLVDTTGEVRELLEVDYVPTLLFVDRDGVIQFRGANLPAVLGGDGTFG
jgi:hypothetical protein